MNRAGGESSPSTDKSAEYCSWDMNWMAAKGIMRA